MPTGTGTVSCWQDDPESGALITVPTPNPGQSPLSYSFPPPAPPPDIHPPGTAEFRFWNAAAALRRGADFWATRIPSHAWQMGNTLPVLLDEGVDLNAYYDRQALNFFHGPGVGGITVYSGESPDVLCHEMGHAVLDAIKPQLWNAASIEAAAFHESFGDMSAILSALQIPELRTAILQDTHGQLYTSSRLSRLAEQLGSALRAQDPSAAEPDCLRNAVNAFAYQNPVGLPPMAPASHLSSEPHSFSRVFTGAFFESLAGMLRVVASDPAAPTEQELLNVSNAMADILVSGIIRARVVSNFYAQVAAGMIQASTTVNPKFNPVLRRVFAARNILSLHLGAEIVSLQTSITAATVAAAGPQPANEALALAALPASHYGLEQPLLVELPSQGHQFAAAATDAAPVSSAEDARAFVDDLFRRGRVDYANLGRPEARLAHGHRRPTHRLRADKGGVRLERCLFECGWCNR